MCCFFAAGPQHINVFDLATWVTLKTELMVWEAAISDSNGCIDLIHPKSARPQFELSDMNCPTMSLLVRLHELAFRPATVRVEHKDAVHVFDSRETWSKIDIYKWRCPWARFWLPTHVSQADNHRATTSWRYSKFVATQTWVTSTTDHC